MHCPALTDAQTRFSIPAESDLVEIWLDSEHSKVLLGVHMLRRDAADSMGPSEAVIPFGGQNNLRLAISALPVERGRLLTVSVCCEPATLGHWWRNSWRCFADWAASAPQYALSGFAILFVASVMTAFYAVRSNVASRRSDARLQQELAASRKQAVDLQREIESRRDSATLSAYRLVPDEAIVRGAANSQVPSIGISTQPGLIRLELRVHGASHPFQAQLRTFSTRRLLLSQEQLAPVEISGGAVLVFDCPSAIFRPRASYVIELSTVAKSGVRETVSSFTFQTTDRE